MLQILIGIVLFYIFIVSFQAIAFKSAIAGKEEILKRIESKLDYLSKLCEKILLDLVESKTTMIN